MGPEAGTIFATRIKAASADAEARVAKPYEQIGRLKMKLEWMKTNLPPSAERKQTLLDVGHAEVSTRRRCELLGLNRSSLYYEPAGETPENLQLMRVIDEQYTDRPYHVSRRMTRWLTQQGEPVIRKRVQPRAAAQGVGLLDHGGGLRGSSASGCSRAIAGPGQKITCT